ncbi:MAG: RsmE family RNA methyltransferase [Bacilli bacterium]
MQRYFSKELKNNIFTLNKDDLYHIIKVMRMKQNELIEVVFDHEVYLCKLNADYEADKIKIIEKDKSNIIKRVLIIPLLKEQKFDLILQKATELGVDEIIPVIMERSVVKRTPEKEEKKLERWSKIIKEASEQSKRTDIPSITKVRKLNELEELDGLKMVCSTSTKTLQFKNFLTNNKNYDKINIVIGPEGGISPKEEEYLEKIGFTRVSLGSKIMRVETVPMFVLSVLNYENME